MAAVHTWKMDKTFWPLRLYAWAWDASLLNVNFCKFFWGLLFSPIGVFLKSAAIALKFIGRRVAWLFWNIPEPGRAFEIVAKAILAGLIWLVVAALTMLALVQFEAFTTIVLVALGAVGSVVLMIGLIYVLTEYGSALKRQRLLVVLARGGEAVLAALAWAAFVLSWPVVRLVLAARSPIVAKPTLAFAGAAGGTISTGGGIIAAFYHMIKDQTCPSIDVQGLSPTCACGCGLPAAAADR